MLDFSPLARSSDEDLTFVPQTNGVSNDMPNAQFYLKEDVFSRLSQRCEHESAGKASSSSAGLQRSWSDAGLGDSVVTRFLERQNEKEEERLDRLEGLQVAASPPGRPEINGRSARLAERRRERTGESFSSEKAFKPLAEPPLEPECTFRPKITQAAKEARTRTPAQLGPEDYKRKLAKREKLVEAKEKKELEELRDPKVRSYNAIGGRLRLIEDIDGLLGRIDKKREREQQRSEKCAEDRAKQEMAECSFKPEVKKVPAFVQQMAATRRAARAQTEADSSPSEQPRPDWH